MKWSLWQSVESRIFLGSLCTFVSTFSFGDRPREMCIQPATSPLNSEVLSTNEILALQARSIGIPSNPKGGARFAANCRNLEFMSRVQEGIAKAIRAGERCFERYGIGDISAAVRVLPELEVSCETLEGSSLANASRVVGGTSSRSLGRYRVTLNTEVLARWSADEIASALFHEALHHSGSDSCLNHGDPSLNDNIRCGDSHRQSDRIYFLEGLCTPGLPGVLPSVRRRFCESPARLAIESELNRITPLLEEIDQNWRFQ